MTTLSLEDAIAIEGGPLEVGSGLPGVPEQTVRKVCATLIFLVNVFLNNLQDREFGIFIALTRSSGLACRVRQLSDGSSVILVPAGLVGRLRTLCRTLLRYWDKEHRVVIGNSPLDKIPEDQWQVPPKLAPLFDHTDSGEPFWKHLEELDDSLDLDPRFETDVGELLHLGLVFLLCHEFAHVFFRHFEFLAAAKQETPDGVSRIRRGLELHADSFAGTWAITIFLGQVGANIDSRSLSRGFLRQSYVVTAVLALFDAQRKFVGLYDQGDYNHPLIRREVFADACRKEVSLQGQTFFDSWQEVEMLGWQRAVFAFADLNLEAMDGKFGKVSKGKLAYPLQALNYGAGASVLVLQKILDESLVQLEDVKKQIVAFNKQFGSFAAKSGL